MERQRGYMDWRMRDGHFWSASTEVSYLDLSAVLQTTMYGLRQQLAGCYKK